MSATTDRLMDTLRINLPGAVDPAISLTIFRVVDELCHNWLQITRPSTNQAIDAWLTPALWEEHYRLIIDGVTGRMMVEQGKPYSKPELGQAHLQAFSSTLMTVRPYAVTASTPSSFERIMMNIRMNTAPARDNTILNALYNTVEELCRDGLQIPVPANTAAPATWLSEADWNLHQRLLVHGTIYRILGQLGTPWFSAEGSAAYSGVFAALMDLVRAHTAKGTSTSPYERIMANLRVRVKGARDGVIQQELFNVVSTLTRDALQIDPPDQTLSPELWLDDAVWDEHFFLLIEGTAARLLSHVDRSYGNADMSKIALDTYAGLLSVVRANATAGPQSGPVKRLMENLRVQLPSARDSVISLELYNTIEELYRSALYEDAPDDSDPVDSWLTDERWKQHYSFLLHGTLFRMMSHAGKPWSNPEGVAMHHALYQERLTEARNDANSGPNTTAWTQFMDSIRAVMPAVKDSMIDLEYFNVVEDLCRQARCYRTTLEIQLVAGQQAYPLVVDAARVVYLYDASSLTLSLAAGGLLWDETSNMVSLEPRVTAEADGDTLFVNAALVPVLKAGLEPINYIPEAVRFQNYECLVEGVKARLYSQVGKPYSNLVLAQMHGRRYRSLVGAARKLAAERSAIGPTWVFPTHTR